ncbi:MAG: hypothetical protein JW717_14350 [Marinilabiliaceae bacterium]|nr:hypothetical protein [Marinilabiliaceae bacterium]
MYKHLFKFAVLSITILTAELLTDFITNKLISHKWEYHPIRFTLISMAIITILFYPLFTKLEEWINRFSKRFIKAGHSYFGKYIGLLLMYLIALLILTFFYAQMWYNINIFNYLFRLKLFT